MQVQYSHLEQTKCFVYVDIEFDNVMSNYVVKMID